MRRDLKRPVLIDDRALGQGRSIPAEPFAWKQFMGVSAPGA